MAHVIKRKLFNLQFPEHEDLEGATIKVRSVSFGKLMDVAGLAEAARGGVKLAEVKELLELFVERLEFWDLADEDGSLIPTTMEGLLSLEPDIALEIVLTWADVLVSVKRDRDLGKGSTSGEPFPEAHIPMEVA